MNSVSLAFFLQTSVDPSTTIHLFLTLMEMFPLSQNIAYFDHQLVTGSLYHAEKVYSYSQFLRVFTQKLMLKFFNKCFFGIYEDDHTSSSEILMEFINRLPNNKPGMYFQNESSLIMIHCSFNIKDSTCLGLIQD